MSFEVTCYGGGAASIAHGALGRTRDRLAATTELSPTKASQAPGKFGELASPPRVDPESALVVPASICPAGRDGEGVLCDVRKAAVVSGAGSLPRRQVACHSPNPVRGPNIGSHPDTRMIPRWSRPRYHRATVGLEAGPLTSTGRRGQMVERVSTHGEQLARPRRSGHRRSGPCERGDVDR